MCTEANFSFIGFFLKTKFVDIYLQDYVLIDFLALNKLFSQKFTREDIYVYAVSKFIFVSRKTITWKN